MITGMAKVCWETRCHVEYDQSCPWAMELYQKIPRQYQRAWFWNMLFIQKCKRMRACGSAIGTHAKYRQWNHTFVVRIATGKSLNVHCFARKRTVVLVVHKTPNRISYLLGSTYLWEKRCWITPDIAAEYSYQQNIYSKWLLIYENTIPVIKNSRNVKNRKWKGDQCKQLSLHRATVLGVSITWNTKAAQQTADFYWWDYWKLPVLPVLGNEKLRKSCICAPE